ncbi:MAG: hypothetical protein SOT71_05170 [Romboutsia timonensis]|nr:hypothetical protein [Romboutsia timonensis]MDY2882025.1 hypothetical protein [Romboutsia timonensis]
MIAFILFFRSFILDGLSIRTFNNTERVNFLDVLKAAPQFDRKSKFSSSGPGI